VVGDDHVDDSLSESLPQSFSIPASANRRSTFFYGVTFSNAIGMKMQIMRAGLDRDGKSFRARGLKLGQSLCGCEMDDVQAEVKLAAQSEHEPDGGEFRGIRP
jgi:hypothetical protein